jgi:hypothetical protein
MAMTHLIAGIAWDPQIRGFLALGVGIVVLLGSVYLVMVTNLGTRLGFLVAAAAFWGWMAIMGLVWAISTRASSRPPSSRRRTWTRRACRRPSSSTSSRATSSSRPVRSSSRG